MEKQSENPVENPASDTKASRRKAFIADVAREVEQERQDTVDLRRENEFALQRENALRTMRIEHATDDLQGQIEILLWMNAATLIVLLMVLIRTYGLI